MPLLLLLEFFFWFHISIGEEGPFLEKGDPQLLVVLSTLHYSKLLTLGQERVCADKRQSQACELFCHGGRPIQEASVLVLEP